MNKDWITYFGDRGQSEQEAIRAKNELIDAAEKTFSVANRVANISDFDEWCELILIITEAYRQKCV